MAFWATYFIPTQVPANCRALQSLPSTPAVAGHITLDPPPAPPCAAPPLPPVPPDPAEPPDPLDPPEPPPPPSSELPHAADKNTIIAATRRCTKFFIILRQFHRMGAVSP